MVDLPWNINIIDWLLQNRTDIFTNIFLFFTFLGDSLGYIIVVITIYWLYDKKVAIKVTFALILSLIFNQILKNIIQNPRPYVNENTYDENWAISENDIEETAHSFSTPSGHAQGSMTFWHYFHKLINSKLTRIFTPIIIFLIGFSRPYLGVHYFEDIILGWIIGYIIVILIGKYETTIASKWDNANVLYVRVLSIIAPILFILFLGFTSGFETKNSTIVTLAGVFSGLVISITLEQKLVNFNPALSSISPAKRILNYMIRLALGFTVLSIPLFGLDTLFSSLVDDNSILGFLFRWLRYSIVTFFGIIVVPLLFIKMGLSDQLK